MEEAKHEWISAEGVRSTFTPAGIFEVAEHPDTTRHGRRYALRRLRYSAGAVGGYTSGEKPGDQPWNTEFEAIPESIVFRPERKTPRPVVEGPQTAVVVGPSGEEIYTDEHGRIKVQSHWDREGSQDENSSCRIIIKGAPIKLGEAGAPIVSLPVPPAGPDGRT